MLIFKKFIKGFYFYVIHLVIYSHNKYAYIHIYMFMQHHNDTIIDRRTMIKTQWQRQTPDKDAGRLLYNIFYLTSLFVSFERAVPSLRVRESWRPNITEIFWPWSYGRQRCLSCSPWLLNRSTGFPYYISSTTSTLLACLHWLVELNCPELNSSVLYYLQTPTRWYGHASTTTSDIWGPGCVTSAFFGMACVSVIERK